MLTAALCDLPALAAMIPNGATLAVPSENSGVAMAATRELIRRGVRKLHLILLPAIRPDIALSHAPLAPQPAQVLA